jgi:hypothetical protein
MRHARLASASIPVRPTAGRAVPECRGEKETVTGALLDRLTHHVHILEMNGDNFRLSHSKRRSRCAKAETSIEDPPGAAI